MTMNGEMACLATRSAVTGSHGTPPGAAALPASAERRPCHTFSAFRAGDGRWTLTQRESDFSRVFIDPVEMLAFARTFCHGDQAIIALRNGRHGVPALHALSALVSLAAADLTDLLAREEASFAPRCARDEEAGT